jgi:hypothetical protein
MGMNCMHGVIFNSNIVSAVQHRSIQASGRINHHDRFCDGHPVHSTLGEESQRASMKSCCLVCDTVVSTSSCSLLPVDTRGRLVKATRLKGIQDFKASANGLHPIALDTWGHFVFIHLQGGAGRAAGAAPAQPPGVAEWLGVCQMGCCSRCSNAQASGLAVSTLQMLLDFGCTQLAFSETTTSFQAKNVGIQVGT